MRSTMLAVLALSAAITTQAKADYVWRFVPTHVEAVSGGDGNPFSPWVPAPGISDRTAKSWLPEFKLTVTDAAFKSGSIGPVSWGGCNLFLCSNPPSGDFSKFVSFTGVGPFPTTVFGSGDMDLTWNRHGKMAGGAIDYFGDVHDFVLGSDGPNWTGYFAGDDSECGVGVAMRCAILAGHWKFLGDPPGRTSVPEPASIAVLAAGLLGIGAVRSRRA